MVYYKIPISDGVFDYPAGCVLCCAYPYDGYMYCKFESITTIGTDWIQITESEFDVRCPEFPTPSIVAETESTDYPGCHYRMVDGEQEWINPPMAFGEVYRTTERFNGKPVYACAAEIPALEEDGITTFYAFLGEEIKMDVFHVSGSLTNGTWHMSTDDRCEIVIYNTGRVVIDNYSAVTGCYGTLLFKFVKQEGDE